jgi:hypothetical protein
MLSLHREFELCGDDAAEFSAIAEETVALLESRLRFKPDVPLARSVESVVYRALPEPLALRLACLTANAYERLHSVQSGPDEISPVDEILGDDGGGESILSELQELKKGATPDALPRILNRWDELFGRASLFAGDYSVWSDVQTFAMRMVMMAGHWISFREGLRMLEMVEPSRRADCLINLCGNEIHKIDDLPALCAVISEHCSLAFRLDAHSFLEKIVEVFGVIGTEESWDTGLRLIRELVGDCDDRVAIRLAERMLRERILSLGLQGDWGEAERMIQDFGCLALRRSALLSMALIAASRGESGRCSGYRNQLEACGEPSRKWRFHNVHRAISFLLGDESVRVEAILEGFEVVYPEVRFGDSDYLGTNIELAACLIARVMMSRRDVTNHQRVMEMLDGLSYSLRVSWFFGEYQEELGCLEADSSVQAMMKWHQVLPWERPTRYSQRVHASKQNVPVEQLLSSIESKPDLTLWEIDTVRHGVQVMVCKARGEAVGRLLELIGEVNFFSKVVLIGALQKALEGIGCEDARVAELLKEDRIKEAVSEIELHVGRKASIDEREELERVSIDEALATNYMPLAGDELRVLTERVMRSGVAADQEKVFRFAERAVLREMSEMEISVVEDSLKWADALECLADASVRLRFVERMKRWFAGLKDALCSEKVSCFYGVELAASGDVSRGMELVARVQNPRVRCSGLGRMAARLLVERGDSTVFDIFASGLRHGLEIGRDCSPYSRVMAEFGEVCLRFRHRDAFSRLLGLAMDTAAIFDGYEDSLARLFTVAHAFEMEEAWVSLLVAVTKKPDVSLSSIGYRLEQRRLPLTRVSDDVRVEAAAAMVSVSVNRHRESMGQILWFVLMGAGRPETLLAVLESRFPVLSTGLEEFLKLSEGTDFPVEALSSLASHSEQGLLVLHQVILRKWMHEGSLDDVFQVVGEACESFSNDDM